MGALLRLGVPGWDVGVGVTAQGARAGHPGQGWLWDGVTPGCAPPACRGCRAAGAELGGGGGVRDRASRARQSGRLHRLAQQLPPQRVRMRGPAGAPQAQRGPSSGVTGSSPSRRLARLVQVGSPMVMRLQDESVSGAETGTEQAEAAPPSTGSPCLLSGSQMGNTLPCLSAARWGQAPAPLPQAAPGLGGGHPALLLVPGQKGETGRHGDNGTWGCATPQQGHP